MYGGGSRERQHGLSEQKPCGQTLSSPRSQAPGLARTVVFPLLVGSSRATREPVGLILTQVAVLSSACLYVSPFPLPPLSCPKPDLGLSS